MKYLQGVRSPNEINLQSPGLEPHAILPQSNDSKFPPKNSKGTSPKQQRPILLDGEADLARRHGLSPDKIELFWKVAFC